MRCDFKSRNIILHLTLVCLSVFLATWWWWCLAGRCSTWYSSWFKSKVVVVVCFSFSCKVQTVISMIHYLQIMDLMDDPKCYGPKFYFTTTTAPLLLLLSCDENLLFFREEMMEELYKKYLGITMYVFTQYL